MNSRNWKFVYGVAVCITAVLACAQVSAQAAFDETAAIGVLTGDSTPLQKQETCRALRQKGTAACIPALAAMLPDQELSHMARYALEAMPYPEAGQALRDALPRTEGACKVGVITTLGVRRDAKAVALLVPALGDANVDVARAAAGALGRIGTPSAAKALLAFRKDASATVKPALAEGLLAAGQYLTQDGKGRKAAGVYNQLLDTEWPMYARMGAFHGLADAQPKKAPKRLLAALAGDEPQFRDMAAQIVTDTKSATKLYAKALPALSPEGQIALLRGLAGRKDLDARPAVAAALSSSDPDVKLAAVNALGALGSAEDVPTLAAMLTADDAEAANASLTAMEGNDIDPAIVAVAANATPVLRAKLLELLGNRRSEQAVPLAVAGLKDADPEYRAASLNVLAFLGHQEQFPEVMALLAATTDTSERSAAEKALIGITARGGEAAIAAVLGGLNGANPATTVVLLRVLASTGNPKALDTVIASLDAVDETVRNEAGWAIVAAATELAKNPAAKAQAVSALNTVIAKSANADIKQRAQEVLAGIK